MVYLAVDNSGIECIFRLKPTRSRIIWLHSDENYVDLPDGSIEKLIGRKLTWKDEPVELK